MARPLPLSLRTRFELIPPARGTMEAAFHKASLTLLPPTDSTPPPGPGAIDVSYLYIADQGAVLRKAGDRLLVEKDDEVVLDLPYHKLDTVLLFGNVQVTTQAMAELLEKGVQLSLFSRQGFYRGSLLGPRGANVDLRLKQFQLYGDPARSLSFARAIVKAKIANAVTVLDAYRAHNDASPPWATKRDAIAAAVNNVDPTPDLSALNGVEGAAARAYFDCLMEFNRSDMTWPGRQKHPSNDPLNALLSFTYTLLMHELTALAQGVGLEPYLGFLHQLDYGRPSLALDLVEPFRHPFADRLVLTVVNRAVIQPDDFQRGGERPGLFLAPKALKRYVAEYERWMLASPLPAPADSASPSTPRPRRRDLLKADVERLAAALRDGHPFQPYLAASPEPPCNTSSVTI